MPWMTRKGRVENRMEGNQKERSALKVRTSGMMDGRNREGGGWQHGWYGRKVMIQVGREDGWKEMRLKERYVRQERMKGIK